MAGLYSDKLKSAIVGFVREYWVFVLIAWVGFTIFDVKIILPGERTWNDQKSGVLTSILKNGKEKI